MKLSKFQIIILSILSLVACIVIAGVSIAIFILLSEPEQTSPRPMATPNTPTTPKPTPTYTHLPNTPTPRTMKMGGKGDAVWDVTTNGGVAIVTSWHVGDGNFIIRILDESGNFWDLAANCIDDCQEQKVIRFAPGKYLVEIAADGEWEAKFAFK